VTRRTRAAITVALGVAVVLGYVVWTVVKGATAPTPTAGSAGTAGRTTATARTVTSVDPETKLPWIEVSALPSQGRQVLALIDKGGPYPYSQDGGVFSNAERLLPIESKGFYTEYTVKLPSSSDRGPVRIIMGGRGQWYFWTDDHYASFSRIRR